MSKINVNGKKQLKKQTVKIDIAIKIAIAIETPIFEIQFQRNSK